MTYVTIKATEFFEKFQDDPNGVILDVRSEKEYQEGHIDGAVNIVFTNSKELINLDKNKNYYLHCGVGGRSAIAAFTMVQAGFEHVYKTNDTFETLRDLFYKDPA